jgi:hypothetical protein
MVRIGVSQIPSTTATEARRGALRLGKILDTFCLRGTGRGRHGDIDLDELMGTGSACLAHYRRFLAAIGSYGRNFRRRLVVANDKCLALEVVVVKCDSL